MRAKIREKIMNSDEMQIDLHDMAITDNEINEIISEIIKIRPNARTLILRNNSISDKGAIFLGENLAELSNLSFIDLQFNNIHLEGAEGVFKLQSTHPDLRIAFHGNMVSDVSKLYEIEQKYARHT